MPYLSSRNSNRTLLVKSILPLWITIVTSAYGQEKESGFKALEDKSQEQETKASKPIPIEEFVFVQGDLPYIPKSNTIITKLPIDLRLIPANVGTVTGPLFREQLAQTVSGALKNISNINNQPGLGVFDFFLLRGFDSLSSSLILTDGAPEPEASFHQLYNVDRVEVYKGPGGYLYGSNPLAGVVNLVRKQPVPGKFIDFGGTFGTHAHKEARLDFNIGSSNGPASFRVNSLYRDANSHRQDKEGRFAAINPSLAFRFGETTKLNINLEYVDSEYIPDSGVPLLDNTVSPVGRETNYQSPLDTSQQEIIRFQIDFETELNDRLLLRNKFYIRDLDWLSGGTLYNGVFPSFQTGQLEVSRTLIFLKDQQLFTGNQLEAVLSFDTGPFTHNLLSGVEIAQFSDTFTLTPSLIPSVDLMRPVDPGPNGAVALVNFFTRADARSEILAPYAIDQIKLSDQIHLLIGARLDRIHYFEETQSSERKDTKLSPMVGFLVAPQSTFSVYGNYSRAFAPPSARVVGEAVPEESMQIEFGFKTQFRPWKASSTFAIYHLERENIAIPDDNGFTQQIGNQQSRGFEFELSVQPNRRTRSFIAYAYNDSVLTNFTELVQLPVFPPAFQLIDHSGHRPTFAPKHILNVWIGSDLRSGFGIGGGARFVSEQFIAEDNRFAIDAVLTFDATVSYQFKNALFRFNLMNLTNKQYFARGFGSNAVVPAPPFTAFLSLDLRL